MECSEEGNLHDDLKGIQWKPWKPWNVVVGSLHKYQRVLSGERLIQELYLCFGEVVSLFIIPSCVCGGINSFLFHMGVT